MCTRSANILVWALVNSVLLFVLTNAAPPIVVTLCYFPLVSDVHFPNHIFFLDIVKHFKSLDCNIGLDKHETLNSHKIQGEPKVGVWCAHTFYQSFIHHLSDPGYVGSEHDHH